jgi:hypothetical protein
MENLVEQILDNWRFGLCTIVATFITIAIPIIGFYLWCYQRLFTKRPQEPIARVDSTDAATPIVLGPNHCKAPEDFGYLRDRTVQVTGLITHTYYDENPPYLLLHPFPFDIDADVRCEFVDDKARMIRRLESLKLVTVIGKTNDGIQVDKHCDDVKLTLRNCEIGRPSFFIWLRHELHDLITFLRWGL